MPVSDFLNLLRSSIHGERLDLSGQEWSHERIEAVRALAKGQAVEGSIIQGFLDSGVNMGKADARDLFMSRQTIWQRNTELDIAVVSFCQKMKEAGIRIYVLKGQTYAALYPVPKSRSSGDIDFFCHPDDWDKAILLIRELFKVEITNTITPKHVEFKYNGISYEMHRMMASFAYPPHKHYWDLRVLPEVLASSSTIAINGADVPILPPTVNALYVFVHLFIHFISDGLGLRQICDWLMVLKKTSGKIDYDRLRTHLEGLGLMKAYTGFGALLTDYLGLEESQFPFPISEKDHRKAPALLDNIIKKGNFGKNIHYKKSSGPIHGIQHVGRIFGQAWNFGSYAPAESWWQIPHLFGWWLSKIGRMMRHAVNKD